jgi:hypothetical protein
MFLEFTVFSLLVLVDLWAALPFSPVGEQEGNPELIVDREKRPNFSW